MNIYAVTRLARVILLCLALGLVGTIANAQTTQGIIAGNVLDSSGAVIPNATVTAKSELSGTVFTSVSSSVGAYRFPSVPLGRYTLTTTAAGFKSTVNTGVEVRVASTTAFEITLSAGGSNEVVTVQSDLPTIETQSSDVSGTVTTKQIVDLPLALGGVGALRSPEAFVFLIPRHHRTRILQQQGRYLSQQTRRRAELRQRNPPRRRLRHPHRKRLLLR